MMINTRDIYSFSLKLITAAHLLWLRVGHLVPVLLLHTVRLRQDPVLFLFQLPLTAPLIVGNLRLAFVQWIVARLGQGWIMWPLLRHEFGSPFVRGAHLHIGKVALV